MLLRFFRLCNARSSLNLLQERVKWTLSQALVFNLDHFAQIF